MKKILLLVILTLNLGISINNAEIRITTSNNAYSQAIPCPRAPGSSSFWDRLKTAVGDFVTNVWDGIKDFFSNDEDGSNGGDDEGMGEEEDEQTEMQEKYDYNDDGFNYDPFGDNGQNPWDEPTFNNDNWGEQEWYIIENLAGAIHYFQQEDNGFPMIVDSSYRIKNNLKPTRDTCVELESKIASDSITSLYNKIDTLRGFNRVRDSAFKSKNEVTVSIVQNNGVIDTAFFEPGSATGGFFTISNNTIALVHTHTVSSELHKIDYTLEPINSPSLVDIGSLIKSKLNYKKLEASFIITADGTVLGLSVEDTTKAKAFLDYLIANSAIDTITHNWAKTKYKGNDFTHYDVYVKIRKALLKLGYEYRFVDLYANVIMLNNVFQSGVSIKIKVNGKFKEIRADALIDLELGIQKINNINICK